LTGGIGFLVSDVSGKASRLNINRSNTSVGFIGRVAGGADLFVHRNFSLYAEAAYIMPTGDVGDLYHVSVGWGLKYNFNY